MQNEVSAKADALFLGAKRSGRSQKNRPAAARALLAALAFTVAAPTLAVEAGGVRFDDKLSLAGSELVANGAGVRTKFVFDVYAIALYLPARASSLEAIARGPRRIAIQLLRNVAAADFVDALKTGMQANLGEGEFAALGPQIAQFSEIVAAGGEVKKGSPVTIDYLPGAGTRVSIGGRAQGKDIAGEAFYDALLRIWLGAKPVQSDLKSRLLGK